MSDLVASVTDAVRWWLVVAAMGLAARAALGTAWPVGDALARALARWGIVIAPALLVWGAAHAMPVFDAPYARALALIAFAALALAAASRGLAAWRLDDALRGEARFALAFVAYLVMRGFNHDVFGLEKFMDFGFVSAALFSPTMPPPDPWLAGATINYYYFGHVVTAYLIDLTGVPPAVGFNLMLATIFAASFELASAIVGELAGVLAPRAAAFASVLAGLWITVGGNLHGFVYGLVRPVAVKLGALPPPAKPYWISDSTRFVGHDPPTADKLIHEFPAYALYVGDLHAHVLGLATVLAILAVLLVWLRLARRGSDRASYVAAAVLGAGTGTAAITNAWDGAIVGTLVAATVLAGGRFFAPGGMRRLALTVACGSVALAAVVAPFLWHFTPFAAGVALVHSRTPPWQWLLVYGAQVALALLAVVVARPLRDRATGAEWRLLAAFLAGGLACALFAEVWYVKDIYPPDWYRANTAFKFGYQGFVLLVLGASTGMALLLDPPTARGHRWRAVAAMELVVVPCLYYGWFVASSALAVAPVRPWTLDGWRYLARETPEDLGAIRWLRAHARPGDTIVEAAGNSYTYAGRISANTGVPALIGWPMHEWLWRGVSKSRDLIPHEIAALYRDPAGRVATTLIARARPRYIVVGRLERQQHGPVDVAGVESLGEVVWRGGQTSIVRLPR